MLAVFNRSLQAITKVSEFPTTIVSRFDVRQLSAEASA
jgi:hypothetical protein